MSATQQQALSAIAFQFAAALQAYELDVGRLARTRLDPELYQRISARMDEMRLYAASVPELSAAWVEVVIRHFELTHALWRQQQKEAQNPDLGELQEQLQHAVQRLQRKCLQLMPRA